MRPSIGMWLEVLMCPTSTLSTKISSASSGPVASLAWPFDINRIGSLFANRRKMESKTEADTAALYKTTNDSLAKTR